MNPCRTTLIGPPILPPMSSEADRIRKVYESDRYTRATNASDWSAAWHPRNLGAVYYRHQFERALISALNDAQLAVDDVDILDAGCGTGGHLRLFTTLGADPERVHGVDLTPERIELAKRLGPGDYRVGDVRELDFDDESMDIVSQFTALCNLTAPEDRRRFASEMARVLRPGGHVVWFDLQHQAHEAPTLPVSPQELRTLFPGFRVVLERPMFHRWTQALIGNELTNRVLERVLPGKRSNLLAILAKPM
jgi:ubiquinone/menaquinone biosynthesis C-methylase UbiE